MDTRNWTDLLYSDEAIAGGLTDVEAQQLLSWAESYLETCETETDALHLFDSLRLLNRYVENGESFDQLFAALRANFQAPVADGSTPAPGELDARTDTIYPPGS